MGSFFDLPNTLITLATSANFFFVFLVIANNRRSITQPTMFFLGGATSVVFWSFFMLCFRNTETQYIQLISARLLYMTAALIPYFFVLFVNSFGSNFVLGVKRIFYISVPVTVIIFISLIPEGLIISTASSSPEPSILFHRTYHLFYIIYQVIYFTIAFLFLLKTYLENEDSGLKKQAKYIFIGTFITASVSVVTNLILPYFNFFLLNWVGQAASVSMIAFISLSLLEDKLFNLQTAATRLVIFILASFLFIKILISLTPSEMTVNIFVFVFVAIFGYILDKSVRETIRQREEINKLAKTLTETNWELAKTNERLRVIDQRKSEFVSIVSHQLRTPITAIKGYTSLLLEDTYGPLTDLQKPQVEKVFISSNRLAAMVNDFLDISKIEQGTMAYNIEKTNVKQMITELVDDFTPIAKSKGLALNFSCANDISFDAQADSGKLRQIFSNIIDNSIKYTQNGYVSISLENNISTKELTVKVIDTGVGLSQDDLHHLFGKFARGSQGQSQNTEGSGLGLYVAKKMLEAMNGKIWVDSEGTGKGSTFVIVLKNTLD